MRDVLTGIAVFLIVVLSAALAAPWFIDWTDYRGSIERALSRAAGHPVTVGGNIRLHFLPTPYASFEDIEVAGEDPTLPLLQADRASGELALMPLLGGHWRITQATIDAPIIRLPTVARALPEQPRELSARSERIAIDKLLLRHAKLILRAKDGSDKLAASGDLDLEASGLTGPWRAAGKIEIGRRLLNIRLNAGSPDAEGRIATKIGIEEGGLAFVSEWDGFIARPEDPSQALFRYEGKFTAAGHSPWPFTRTGDVPWRISGQGKSEGPVFVADNVEMEAGPTSSLLKGTGTARIDLRGDGNADLKLRTRTLDLDRLFKPPPDVPQEVEVLDPSAALAAFFRSVVLPTQVNLDAESVIARGEIAGPASAVLKVTQGQLQLERFESVLPGRARVTLTGGISAESGPIFSGRIAFTAGEVGKAFSWLTGVQQTAPGLPPRFAASRDLRAGADLRVSASGFAMRDLELNLDGATVKGDLSYESRIGQRRGQVNAKLAADRLDLDLIPDLQTLLRAGLVDAAVEVQADALRIPGLSAASAGRLDLKLDQRSGQIALERFALAGEGGFKLNASGRLSAHGGRVTGDLEATRLDLAVALARRLAPGGASEAFAARAKALEPANLTLTIDRPVGENNATLELGGDAGGTTLKANIKSRLDPEGNVTGFDQVDVRADGKNPVTLLRQLGFHAADPRQKTPAAEPSAVTFSLMPGPSGPARVLAWTLRADLAGVRGEASGTIQGGIILPSTVGTARLRSTDAGPLARMLGLPAQDTTRAYPLDLASQLNVGITGIAFDDLEGSALGGPIGGSLFLGPYVEPRVTGRLDLPSLSLADLSRFVFDADAVPRGGAIWSAARFANFAASSLPFDVEIRTPSFVLTPTWTATNASMRLTSQPEGFRIPGFGADFAGGRLGFNASIRRDGALATLNGRLEATHVDVLKLGARGVSGNADLVMDFGSSGDALSRMVAGLGGAGDLRLRDTRLDALDPAGIARVIKALGNETPPSNQEALRALVEPELTKGPLEIGSLAAPFSISGGVARLGPVRTILPSAGLSVQAAFDLRTLALDLRGTLADRSTPAAASRDPRDDLGREVAFAFAGPVGNPRRSLDVTMLYAALTTRSVERELERIEALEAEARERASQNRRLRAERDQREAEARAAEDAKRKTEGERKAQEEAQRQEELRRQEEARRETERKRREEVPSRAMPASRMPHPSGETSAPAETRPLPMAPPLDIMPR